MNALTHRETRAHLRSFVKDSVRPPVSAPLPRGPVIEAVKRTAMNAISHAETVAQIGWVKMAGAVVAYAGRIREVDRARQLQRTPRSNTVHNRADRERLERL